MAGARRIAIKEATGLGGDRMEVATLYARPGPGPKGELAAIWTLGRDEHRPVGLGRSQDAAGANQTGRSDRHRCRWRLLGMDSLDDYERFARRYPLATVRIPPNTSERRIQPCQLGRGRGSG